MLKRTLLYLIAWFTVSAAMYAQTTTITGTILDGSNMEPLQGVAVVEKGTTNGVITNPEGKYSITVAGKESVIMFSFLGFLTEEVIVGNQSTIDLTLAPDITTLSEVVVIGYGTVKKADATGAVAVVSSEDFNKGAVNSMQELLVGKTAGVTISTNSGAPGNESTIRVRGGTSIGASNSPLIIIDGVPMENSRIGGSPNALANLNPNDIESVTILKDASATAIYGARAANGVMIITTKRGTSKFRVDYSATFSLATIPELVDVYDGNEYRALIESRYPEGSDARSYLDSANTNWQKEIYQNAFGMDHNLSVSGTAIEKIPFRVSLGYNNTDGILKTYNYERTTLSVGIDPSLFDDHLKIKINIKGSKNNNNFADQGAIGDAVTFDPTKPIKNGNTRWRGYYTWTTGGIDGPDKRYANTNPVARLELTDNTSTVLSSVGNVLFDYSFHFLPELHANLNLGYEYSKSEGHNNVPDSTSWTDNPVANGGRFSPFLNKRNSQLLDFYLNYKKDIAPLQSSIEVMGGYSWSYFYRERNDSITNAARTEPSPNVEDFKSDYYLLAYFGRMIYSFKDRYILTFTLRDDASSRFAPENRWGLFPSLALAWKINEESFLRNIEKISDLKLRLGYGVSGQQDVTGDNDYPYFNTYTYGDNEAMYQLGNSYYHTYRPDEYDYNIKWEETETYNIGLDFGVYNNRITGSVDIYKKLTSDLINTVDVPTGTNFAPTVLTNVGSMENKGIEFTLNAGIISRHDLRWQLGYNVSYNENTVTKLNLVDDPEFMQDDPNGFLQVFQVGSPVHSYNVYQQVYDTDGNPLENVYVDRNGDGAINDNDRYLYKTPIANVLMGISSSLNYKNWDFSFSGRLSLGNYVYNQVKQGSNYADLYTDSYEYLRNMPKYLEETKFENVGETAFSDYFIENASFFRMDNMSLGYRLNNVVEKKMNLYISGTLQNAFVITKYSGLDPEVGNGIDNNFFPRTRVYLLGIKCEF